MIYEIGNEKLKVAVKSLGAELSQLSDARDGTEYLWQGNADYWKGQSPILFPIIGGVPDGTYVLQGKSYSINSHGFARSSEFELLEHKAQELCFGLGYSDETLKQYPFRFDLRVRYRLEQDTLRVQFEVRNLEDREMLFSIGAHPGFNCPLYKEESMEDYRIVFEKQETVQKRMKRGNLLSGEKVEFLKGEDRFGLAHSLFYDGAIIMDGYESTWVELRNRRNPKVIRVEFEGFPYLGIWSAKNDGPFVCIEPWYGVDSTEGDSTEFTRKEGLVRLEAGKRFRCEYRIVIK